MHRESRDDTAEAAEVEDQAGGGSAEYHRDPLHTTAVTQCIFVLRLGSGGNRTWEEGRGSGEEVGREEGGGGGMRVKPCVGGRVSFFF